MSVETEIERIKQAKSSLKTTIERLFDTRIPHGTRLDLYRSFMEDSSGPYYRRVMIGDVVAGKNFINMITLDSGFEELVVDGAVSITTSNINSDFINSYVNLSSGGVDVREYVVQAEVGENWPKVLYSELWVDDVKSLSELVSEFTVDESYTGVVVDTENDAVYRSILMEDPELRPFKPGNDVGGKPLYFTFPDDLDFEPDLSEEVEGEIKVEGVILFSTNPDPLGGGEEDHRMTAWKVYAWEDGNWEPEITTVMISQVESEYDGVIKHVYVKDREGVLVNESHLTFLSGISYSYPYVNNENPIMQYLLLGPALEE